MLLIVLPALTQGIPLLLIPVFSFLSSNQYTEAALLGAPIGVIFVGYLWGKSVQLPDRFWPRYSPMLIAIFYILIFWVVAMFISGGDFTHDAFDWLGIGFIPFLQPILWLRLVENFGLCCGLHWVLILYFLWQWPLGRTAPERHW